MTLVGRFGRFVRDVMEQWIRAEGVLISPRSKVMLQGETGA